MKPKDAAKKQKITVLKSRFAVVSERISLTGDDLRAAAVACGLTLKTPDALDQIAMHISQSLALYVSQTRGETGASTVADENRLFKEVEGWASLGRELLGFSHDEGPQAQIGEYRSAGIENLLVSSLIQKHAESHDYQGLRYLIAGAVDRSLLQTEDDFDTDIEDVKKAFKMLSPILELIGSLANHEKPVPKGARNKNSERALVYSLGNCFETLHADHHRFTFATRDGSDRYGPALDWCRWIMRLVRSRVTAPEVAGLAAWAAQPNTIPELMLQWKDWKKRTTKAAKPQTKNKAGRK